jgi:hypothetical protein
MSDSLFTTYLLTTYARQRAEELSLVARPEHRMEREARLVRHPRRRWRSR